jgi:hypothetical protein
MPRRAATGAGQPDLHFAVGRILREQNKIDLAIALTPRIPSSLSGMKSSVEK